MGESRAQLVWWWAVHLPEVPSLQHLESLERGKSERKQMEVGLVRQGKETPLFLTGALNRTISTNLRSLRGNCSDINNLRYADDTTLMAESEE